MTQHTITIKATLKEIWHRLKLQGHGSDKGDVHSYLDVYEEILSPYRETAKNILEIGVFKGNGLRMWEFYFTGKVYGIDCSETPLDGMADLRPMIAEREYQGYCPRCGGSYQELKINGLTELVVFDDESYVCDRCDGYMFVRDVNKHNIFIMDATNKEQVKKNFAGIKFDVIIEDASHSISQQLEIYDAFKDYIADGGIYVIEDIENIDRDRLLLETMAPDKEVIILDRRKLKNRFDDVLIIIK